MVQTKVEHNQDTVSDDEQKENQNHNVPYNSNTCDSPPKQKICLFKLNPETSVISLCAT